MRRPPPSRALARSAVAAVALAGLNALVGCGPEANPDGSDPDWRPVADALVAAATQDAESRETLSPDPTMFDEPPNTVNGLATVLTPASRLSDGLASVAQDRDVDIECSDVTRERAFELLAEPDDNQPGSPSMLCNLTLDESPFGFVLFAGQDADSTRIWYDVGPDAAHQIP